MTTRRDVPKKLKEKKTKLKFNVKVESLLSIRHIRVCVVCRVSCECVCGAKTKWWERLEDAVSACWTIVAAVGLPGAGSYAIWQPTQTQSLTGAVTVSNNLFHFVNQHFDRVRVNARQSTQNLSQEEEEEQMLRDDYIISLWFVSM